MTATALNIFPVPRHDMTALAESFPSLRGVPGVRPWSAVEVDRWAHTSPAVTSGSLQAAKFVLMVWNPSAKYKSGRFYLADGLGCWDAAHHRAFLAWAAAPWWP